jgi:hypothetical protein
MKHPCAIKNCNKTSDKKTSYGRIRPLDPIFASNFPTDIKDNDKHTNKICNAHWMECRERLELLSMSVDDQPINLLINAADVLLNASPVLSTPPLLAEQPVLANHQSVSVSVSPVQSLSQPLTVLVSLSQSSVQPISMLLEQSASISIPTPARVNRQVKMILQIIILILRQKNSVKEIIKIMMMKIHTTLKMKQRKKQMKKKKI